MLREKMQFKKFIISAADGGIEEEEVNRFLRGHRVIKVEDRYVNQVKVTHS